MSPFHPLPEVYCDFEYRDDGRELICACALRRDTGERVVIDLRTPQGPQELAALAQRWADCVWMAYAAHAELTAFLTAHVPVHAMAWIDLMAAARQITASHGRLFLPIGDTNLVNTLKLLGLPYGGTAASKQAMIELILTTDHLTSAQFDDVVAYCWEDVDCLPALWDSVQSVFAHHGVQYDQRVARFHTDYIKALVQLEHAAKGFPVNVPLLNRLYANRSLVCNYLAEEANRTYDGLYVWDKPKQRYGFKFARLQKLLDTLPEGVRPAEWRRTPSGRLDLSDKYMKELISQYPLFAQFKSTLDLLHLFSAKAVDLRDLVTADGFVPARGGSMPLHTVTGRDGKRVSKGFIFGMSAFLRSLVQPPEGYVLVSADWSQQEVAVAAALSGDLALKAALDTGDVYLALAKMAGAIPPDGTKKSHPLQRQLYKSCQLGIGYGMGIGSLARKIIADLREQGVDLLFPEALMRAGEIHSWHKRTFSTYWSFIAMIIDVTGRTGFVQTLDCWTRFGNKMSKPTALGNYPVQGNAATIMREAVKLLAAAARQGDDSFRWVCSLHDALYLLCREADAEPTRALLSRVMTEATAAVLQHTALPLQIAVDTSVYTHAAGYVDGRDLTTMPAILAMLDAHGV